MNSAAVVQIGNSDGKLSIQRWSDFVGCVDELVVRVGGCLHFRGGSVFGTPWLNACWVFTLDESSVGELRCGLRDLAGIFGQDSIALIVGVTEFVGGGM